MQKQGPQFKMEVVGNLFRGFTWNIDQHNIFLKSKIMHIVYGSAYVYAKDFCPNLILLSQITYKQQVFMLRLKRAILD